MIVFLLFGACSNTIKSDFECSGSFSHTDGIMPATISIKFSDYIWWVSLWKNSDAFLTIKIPNKRIFYTGHILEGDKQFQFFEPENKVLGHLSKQDMKFSLSADSGLFIGSCN